MKIFIFFYTILYCFIFIPLAFIASIWSKKIRCGLQGRFRQIKKIRAFAKEKTPAPLFLFHSSSVGEWEQSIPIIQELKKQSPDIQIVATFFSPSGMKHGKKELVDASFYLPFDIYWVALRFFKILQPTAWVISKYDVWPMFVFAAHSLKIPVILSSAELAEDSTRHKSIFATINTLFYRYLSVVFVVSHEYKERFLNIFPYPDRIIVSGDARYDHIISNAQKNELKQPIELFANPLSLTFIAGSIWPNDEKHLLPAILSIYNTFANVQFILVPHELAEDHIESIEHFFYESSIATERYTKFLTNQKSHCRIVIVDTIGMLAKLYQTTDIAYIGGAFSSGVHNVAEPAIFGNAVLFGPKHLNSHEAVQLKKIEAAFQLTNEQECISILTNLITNKELRITAGTKGKDFIYANKGATKIISHYLKQHI
ncbi:MAG: hypothetical protein M0R02_04405 [Bacteroidales bacterium]|jgi:3-deoxy-D-manno-octulosonic-acid transferase|nr:hypothetical protein [Bacteroidales bacterium]NLK82202.1 hypothetical protein [Bacteroidales bacterium]